MYDPAARDYRGGTRLDEASFWFNALYKGPTVTFEPHDLDGLGESLVRARLLREWSQKDLAVRLGKLPQQVQRWESHGWQRAQLWRVQEAAEALGLELAITVRLRGARSGPPALGKEGA